MYNLQEGGMNAHVLLNRTSPKVQHVVRMPGQGTFGSDSDLCQRCQTPYFHYGFLQLSIRCKACGANGPIF